MPDLVGPQLHRFDNFLLDKQAGTLSRLHPDGRQTGVQIGSRALQILCLLADRRGEIVSHGDIMDAVWPNVAVEPNNLTVQLSALRRVLDANGGQGSCIQNIPGRGYRFVPAITRVALASLDSARATPAADDHSDPPEPTGSAAGDRQMLAASRFAAASIPAAAVRGSPSGPRRSRLVWVAALCLCIAALAARAIWQAEPVSPPQAEAAGASAAAAPVERPRLSLVVLPFDNLGGDGVNDNTVDGIIDDLTTDLARVPGFLVVARNSAATYKGRSIDARRIGQELGVRYAVEGSVRKVGTSLRVNTQLVSTESNEHLWAGRFDAGREGAGYDLDGIVRQLSMALRVRLVDIESARGARERPESSDATDLYLRAQALSNLPPSPQNLSRAVALYERALELDPSSAQGLAGLAGVLLDTNALGNALGDDPAAPARLRRAEELVSRAELLRPDDSQVMFVRVHLLGQQQRCPELIPAAQRAIEVHPSLSGPHLWLGLCMILSGRPADAIPHFEQSIRVNPDSPQIFNRYWHIGNALVYLDRYNEANSWYQKSLAANPRMSARMRGNILASIAAAQALAGETEAARSNADDAMRIWPTLTVRSFYPYRITNRVHAEHAARVREGLRLAGVRDHATEDADTSLPSDNVLHTDYEAPTPITVPGARTIRTQDLAVLVEQRKPLVLDTLLWGKSIPGAVGLRGAGVGGTLSDEFQERLREKMKQLTAGNLSTPVVAMSRNAERFQGRNLALRLAALGYTDVYWYRGGREAWQAAGLPEVELAMQDW